MTKKQMLILLLVLLLTILLGCGIYSAHFFSKMQEAFTPILENIGEFESPDGKYRVKIIRSNPGAMSSTTTLVYKVGIEDEDKSLVYSIPRYGGGGQLVWLADNEICLILGGTDNIFVLGEKCDGEFKYTIPLT